MNLTADRLTVIQKSIEFLTKPAHFCKLNWIQTQRGGSVSQGLGARSAFLTGRDIQKGKGSIRGLQVCGEGALFLMAGLHTNWDFPTTDEFVGKINEESDYLNGRGIADINDSTPGDTAARKAVIDLFRLVKPKFKES